MSMATTRPMSLTRFDFDDLYARHLCRHSQFGINVAHVAALYGLWFGVYATIAQGASLLGLQPFWPLTALAITYLAIVAMNAPYRVSLATAVFLAVFVALPTNSVKTGSHAWPRNPPYGPARATSPTRWLLNAQGSTRFRGTSGRGSPPVPCAARAVSR